MKLRKFFLGALLCGLIFSASGVTPARADIAPPPSPNAGSINPGEEPTMVQMVSETVEIEITGKEGIYQDVTSYEALVSASFTMRNKGDQTEKISVHFPIFLLEDFQVLVGGQELDWVTQTYPDSKYRWAKFDITFPPEKNVVVKVYYTLYCPKWNWPYEPEFSYILETGAGWYGPIGEADIILHLPYQANRYNVVEYPAGAEFSGPEVSWHYKNLEPTAQDNWQVSIVWPDRWEKYLDAKKALDQHPDDPDLLVSYGWAILDLSAYTGKGVYIYNQRNDLFREAKESFNKAALLGADTAEFHSGIANTYFNEYMDAHGVETEIDVQSPTIQFVLEHLYKALLLNPDDFRLWEIFIQIDMTANHSLPVPGTALFSMPEQTFTLSPTNTPTKTPLPPKMAASLASATPTIRSTYTPRPTTTTTPTITSTSSPVRVTATPLPPTPTPQPKAEEGSNSWVVATGIIALVALLGGGFVWLRRRQA